MFCRSGSCGLLARLLLGSVLSCAVMSPFGRRSRRAGWELGAVDEAPCGPCRAGRQVQREVMLRPARRTITRLELEARDQADEVLLLTIDGPPVDALNAAVRTYRRSPDSRDELRAALLPASRELAQRVEAWLAGEPDARRDVSITAHLAGGRAERRFTPWRCVRGRWRKGRAWKVEVEDERDQPAAVLAHPYPVAVSAEVLLSQLAAFVAAVDVVEPTRPPEAAPILHG